MWQQCRSQGCRVILEDFPEGGFISTGPGSEPVSLSVPECPSCCDGVAGLRQVTARLPTRRSCPQSLPDLRKGWLLTCSFLPGAARIGLFVFTLVF